MAASAHSTSAKSWMGKLTYGGLERVNEASQHTPFHVLTSILSSSHMRSTRVSKRTRFKTESIDHGEHLVGNSRKRDLKDPTMVAVLQPIYRTQS